MNPCSIASRVSCGASSKPWACSASRSWRRPSTWSSGTAPEDSCWAIAASTPRSEHLRAQKPVGSSATATSGTKVSTSWRSVACWSSERTTATGVDTVSAYLARSSADWYGDAPVTFVWRPCPMPKQHRILTGQVAAITGAARGIGRATAEAFLREGMKVAIGDLDLATARKTADELGHGTVAFALDVTRRDSVKAFLDGAEAQLGAIDVLVNNAGIMQVGHTLWEEDDATPQRMIDINIHGVMHGVKEIVPRFLARGRGHVVNIASTAGNGGFPGGGT